MPDFGVCALLRKPRKSLRLFSEEFSAFHGLLCLARILPLRPFIGPISGRFEAARAGFQSCTTRKKGPAAISGGASVSKAGRWGRGLRAPGAVAIPAPVHGSGRDTKFLLVVSRPRIPLLARRSALPRARKVMLILMQARIDLRACAAGSSNRAGPCSWRSSRG
jgi:hypothetical protein